MGGPLDAGGGVIWPCAWVGARAGAGPHILPRAWPRVVVVMVMVVVAVVVVRRAMVVDMLSTRGVAPPPLWLLGRRVRVRGAPPPPTGHTLLKRSRSRRGRLLLGRWVISIPLWGVHERVPPRFPEPFREVRLGGVKVRHALPN